jgi:drug/metabolite transporter (DMT)-like permease
MTLTPRLLVLLTLPPLLWAGNALVGRLMVGQIPPLLLNFLRWAIALALLLPLAWRALVPWSRVWARWPYLAALGVLGVGLYNSLQYVALITSSPINVTLVASSLAAWILVVGAVFFRERPTRRQLAGAALGIAGVLVVIGRGSLGTLMAVRFVPGDLAILAATIGWAFYSWLLARPPASMRGDRRPRPEEGWDWAGLLLVQVIFGLAASGVFAAGEQAWGAAPVQWGWGVAAALAYVSLGASIVAYRSWGMGVAQGGPAIASLFANLAPLFAALLSTVVLGDPPQPHHGVAFALIVAGIVVSLPRAARHRSER